MSTPVTSIKPQDYKNGHQTILKTFIRDKTLIEIEFTDGTTQLGRLTQFDNYTLTIMRVFRTRAGHREIFNSLQRGGPAVLPGDKPAFRDDGYRTYFKSCIKGFGAANV